MSKTNFLIRLACLLTLTGYALIHFTWDGRLISQIYSEASVRFFAEWLGAGWRGVFIDGQVNPAYRAFIFICGSIFAAGGLASVSRIPMTGHLRRGSFRVIYWTTALLIAFSAFSGLIDSKLHWNVLIEFSVKIAVPLLFLYTALDRPFHAERHIRLIKCIIAATFTGHGLYALNIFPVPDNFIMMTSNILHTGRNGSMTFLAGAGALDILASILVFLPRTERPALWYMAFWGLVTALARLAANLGTTPTPTYLALWVPEFLVRSGHFLLPLYLLEFTRSSIGKQLKQGT